MTARSSDLEDWLSYSVRRAHLDLDLATAATYMQGRVLEIGAGRDGRRGRFQPPFDQCRSWTYVDVVVDRRPNVAADVQHLPFAERSFNTVVCLEVLEYVDFPQQMLTEITRVLALDGYLVLSTPFLHRADTAHDYWRVTEHGLQRLLRRAGFEVVWLRAQGSALAVAVNILKYVIYALPPGRRRRWLAQGARPVLSWLWWLDASAARHQPVLQTFATGYLVVAHWKAA